MSDVTPIRDPRNDSLLTPQNAVLALIDYQPEQYAGVNSIAHDELLLNATVLARIATAYELPVVLSTVYVKRGMSGTNPELREALPGVPEIDRTTLNSWEDPEFRAAVEQTGRRKLIVAGLWTEICVAFRCSTPCARASRSISSRTPSAASATPRMKPPCSAWSRRAPCRSP